MFFVCFLFVYDIDIINTYHTNCDKHVLLFYVDYYTISYDIDIDTYGTMITNHGFCEYDK